MDPTLWWVLAILLIVVGTIGTFLPGIPGTPVVFAGMALAAWINDFSRIGWVTLVVLGALAALACVVDIAASIIGARRAGASRLALIGAAVGAVIGLFFGIVGILIGPFIGAVAGELIGRRPPEVAARVGFATWIGLAVASIVKAAIVFAMLGTFVASYLIA
jgi:uncharacterized protein YqgC (DUF456 family)